MLMIEFPFLPPTTNQSLMVARSSKRLIHTSKARSFQESTRIFLSQQPHNNLKETLGSYLGKELSLALELEAPDWFTKSETIRKKDIANMEKLLIDTLFKWLQTLVPELDDSQIFSLTLKKVVGSTPKTRIILDLL